MAKLLSWFKTRSSFLTVLVVLIAIPLYPKFPLAEIEKTWVAIRVDDILVGGVLFVWFINQTLKGFPVRKNKIFWPIVLYWLTGAVVVFSALFIHQLPYRHLILLHWLRRIEYMSLFFIGADVIYKKKELQTLIGSVFIALTGAFLYGMGQKYWHWPVISTMNAEFSKGLLLYLDQWTRISSTFAGHYDLAVWLAIILSLSPAIIIFFKSWWQKIIAFIFTFTAFYLLILTASRVSFFAYLIGITTTLFFLKKFKPIIPIVILSLFFGFQSKELNTRLMVSLGPINKIVKKIALLKKAPTPTITIAPTPIPSLSVTEKPIAGKPIPIPTVAEKVVKELRTWPTIEEAQLAAVRSSDIRFKVEWPRAIRAFSKNPLLGLGYSSLGLATDNDYLRLLGESGLLGFAAFALIILSLLKAIIIFTVKRDQNWQLGAGFIGVITSFLANAVFIDVFEASKIAFYFWIMMGVASSLADNNKGK